MAQIPVKNTSFFNLPMSVQRLNPVALDTSSLWFSYAEAFNYAKTDSTAYVGQILTVYDKTNLKKPVTIYYIKGTMVKDETGGTESIDQNTVELVELGSDGAGITSVSALPDLTNEENLEAYPSGSMVFLETDQNLYYSANVSGSQRWIKVIKASDLENLGAGDMLKATYDTDNDGKVEAADEADVAKKVANKLTLTAGGKTVSFDGSSASALEVVASDLITSSTDVDTIALADDGKTLLVNNISSTRIVGSVASALEANHAAEADNASHASTATKASSADSASTAGTADVAKKTQGKLIIGSAEYDFDGSEDLTLTAQMLGAVTEHPIASASQAGIVLPSTGLTVEEGGVLSVATQELTKASGSVFGIVKTGEGIINQDGVISVKEYTLPKASQETLGGVIVDGESISVDASGKISVEKVDVSLLDGTISYATTATDAENATNFKTSAGGTKNIESALNEKIDKTVIGAANGLVPLNEKSKISSEYLPSYVDDVIEGRYVETDGVGAFYVDDIAITPESGVIYIDITTSIQYRWAGTTFASITDPLDYATTADAQAMTSDTKVMTPVRTKEAIAAADLDATHLFVPTGKTLILKCGNSSF